MPMATNETRPGSSKNIDGLKEPRAPPPGSPNNHHNGDAANQKNIEPVPDFLPHIVAQHSAAAHLRFQRVEQPRTAFLSQAHQLRAAHAEPCWWRVGESGGPAA